jgi:hypothetical protein
VEYPGQTVAMTSRHFPPPGLSRTPQQPDA